MLHGLGEQGHIWNLVVDLLLGLWVHVVPEADGLHVLVRHNAGAAKDVREHDLAQINLLLKE